MKRVILLIGIASILNSVFLNAQEVIATKMEEFEDTEEIDMKNVPVPFSVIDEVPIFPGCEHISKAEVRDCFDTRMQSHVKEHLQYPVGLGDVGRRGRAYVVFTIAEDGTIIDITVRNPIPELRAEAIRIINLLPKMTPGRHHNKTVKVNYSITLRFKET